MKTIYYIENEEQHLTAVRELLEQKDFKVFPAVEDWEPELTAFVNFLHDQSSVDKKLAIENILNKYSPDLIIIDVDLGCNSSGDGGDIYDNFLLFSARYVNTPVIYLTITGKSAKRVNKMTRHVTKIINLHRLDANAISGKLLKNIEELLVPFDKKNFFDKMLDSI